MFTKERENDVRPVLVCGPGKTKSDMKEESDINFIMAKYQRTGMIEFASRHEPEYMETDPVDFQEAMNTVNEANAMFADLPSSARKRFSNDPAEFLAFVQEEGNQEELYRLGLAERPEQAETAKAAAPSAAPETPPEAE